MSTVMQTIMDGNLLIDALVRSPLFAACSLYINEALKHVPLASRFLASPGGPSTTAFSLSLVEITCVNRTDMLYREG